MMFNMSRNIWEKNKITNSIIKNVFIDMMNYLRFFKMPSNMFLHHKSVFKNVSLFSTKWMVRFFNKNVSVDNNSATLPIRMFRTRNFNIFSSFIPRFLTNMSKTQFISMFLRHFFACPETFKSSLSFIPWYKTFFESCFWGFISFNKSSKFISHKLISVCIISLTFLLLLSNNIYAQFLRGVTEEDGSPTCLGYQIKIALGNLTDNGDGTCSIADQTGAGGGDEITVNTTAATNANFLDNLYVDWALNAASTPDDITAKYNYAETLAGNPALLTTECIFMADGLMCEGTTADTIEIKLAFPDPATTDKTITLFNATDTVVGKDTTDTLTNKTLAAASNVIDADTAVALAADPADCATSTHFAVGVIASGAATCEAIGDADIPDSVTVTSWVLGTSTATQLTSPTVLVDLIDGVGAVDMDYGSADITDHTFITDSTTDGDFVVP